MENEKNRSTLATLIPMILLVMVSIASGGLGTTLFSGRPNAESSSKDTTVITAKKGVPSHLWNDPFDRRYLTETAQLTQARWRKDIEQAHSAEILYVMLNSRSNPEDVELRLRSRWAVQAALARFSYLPLHSDRLFRLALPMELSQVLSDLLEVKTGSLISFEWALLPGNVALRGSSGGSKANTEAAAAPEKITTEPSKARLIAYVDEDYLCDGNSVERLIILDRILRDLVELETKKKIKPSAALQILGPTTSHVLRKMMADLGEQKLEGSSRLECYSPSASAPFASLLPEEMRAGSKFEGPSNEEGWRYTQNKVAMHVQRPGSDEQLLEKLLQELELRPATEAKDVLLVVEEDHMYGRAFGASLGGQSMPNGGKPRRIWFARGVDGYLPARPSPFSSPGKSVASAADVLARQGLSQSPAHGDALTDYFERLRIQFTSEGRRYAAIGLVGFDVYDKLLILRCLRDEFPQTLFFTTDLDAVMLTREHFGYSHNLLASSFFDLTPETEETRDREEQPVLPFRSSFQTASYMGTRAFLKSEVPRIAPTPPKIFELGRFGAVNLEGREKNKAFGGSAPLRLDQATCLLMIVLAFVVLLFAWHAEHRKIMLTFIFTALFALLSLSIFYPMAQGISRATDEEPFYWNHGISVWPTILMRCLICAVALFLILLQHARFYLGVQQIEKEHEDLKGYDPVEDKRNGFQYVLLPYIELDKADMKQVWAMLKASSGLASVVRCAFFSLPLIFYVWLLSSADNYVHPVRGNDTLHFEKWSGLFAGVALSVAVAQCLEQSIMCTAFVRYFRNSTGNWKKEVSKHFALTPEEAEKANGDLAKITEPLFDLQVVGRITKLMTSSIAAPFIIIALLAISRVAYFDNWNWPWVLIVFLALCFLLCVAAQVMLNSVCAGLRRKALQILQDLLRVEVYATEDKKRHALIEKVIKDVEALKEGAFRPFLEWPMVRIGLLPLLSLGSVPLLQTFAQFYW